MSLVIRLIGQWQHVLVLRPPYYVITKKPNVLPRPRDIRQDRLQIDEQRLDFIVDFGIDGFQARLRFCQRLSLLLLSLNRVEPLPGSLRLDGIEVALDACYGASVDEAVALLVLQGNWGEIGRYKEEK